MPICQPRTRLALIGSFLFPVFFSGIFAANKIDLARIKPVPEGEPVPIADFFRPALLQEPKLNPSGTHMVAIVTVEEDRHRLWVQELKTQKAEGAYGSGDKDIYNVHWLNDHRLLFGLSSNKMYSMGLIVADVGSISDNHVLVQYYGSRLVSVPLKDRLHPLIWNSFDGLDDGKDLGVATVTTSSYGPKLVDLNAVGTVGADILNARDNNERHLLRRYDSPKGGLVTGYLADREGELAFAFTADNGLATLHRLTDGHWTKCPVDLEQIDVIATADEPGQLVAIGPRQEGKPRALQLMDGATGKLGEVLLQDEAYDFDGWLYRNPKDRRILGAIMQRNGPRVVWFNEDYRTMQKLLDGFFPGVIVRILGSDEAQKLFLIGTYSDRQPVVYHWVDLEKRTAGLIEKSAPWIDPKRMQPMNIINFKSRDGHKLDAYLTLPAGASKENPPPLVVLAHGGPWVRDTWGFDGEVQFLASRGYAVLQPNYRGSTGYDWMFPEGDLWDFGKMHDDVTDATKALIASRLIDGKRVAIMGGSFGGFLAVSGVVKEPSLYRCAVTIAGVFDWENLINDTKFDKFTSPEYYRLIRKLGDPKQQKEKFDAISPGRHTDQIQVPVFVAGGTDDHTVEIEQSRHLMSAMDKNHKPYEKLIVREEGHGMHHLNHEVELYSRIETFLAKNLKP